MHEYTPSTVPGCRTPHLWLRDGRSLLDALGPWFTLLRFDPGVDVAPLLRAAGGAGLPLEVLDVQADAIPSAYRHRLVLDRPDHHVAWRGDALPVDSATLVDLIRGAGMA